MKTEGIIELLDKHRKLMEALPGQNLGGFALIVGPTDDAPVEIVLLDTKSDEKSFVTLVRDKLMAVKDSSFPGGVSMPRR